MVFAFYLCFLKKCHLIFFFISSFWWRSKQFEFRYLLQYLHKFSMQLKRKWPICVKTDPVSYANRIKKNTNDKCHLRYTLFAVKRVRFCANTICGKTSRFTANDICVFANSRFAISIFFLNFFLICAKTGPIFKQMTLSFWFSSYLSLILLCIECPNQIFLSWMY